MTTLEKTVCVIWLISFVAALCSIAYEAGKAAEKERRERYLKTVRAGKVRLIPIYPPKKTKRKGQKPGKEHTYDKD